MVSQFVSVVHSKIPSLQVLLQASPGSEKDLIPFIESLPFNTAKETLKKNKRQLTEWEKIVLNDAMDKGLLSRI